MEDNIVFSETKKIGSSTFYISNDRKYFKKRTKDTPELLRKEYQNLKKVHEDVEMENMTFVQPIEVSDAGLITKYIDAESLIEMPLPHLYNEFGETLREFHDLGYVHSHLQFNDVLYDGHGFYLTDLPHLNEGEAIQDLVVPKIGLDSFKIKRPWNRGLYTRCFRKFLRGYGRVERSDFKKAYDEALSDRVKNLVGAGTDRKQTAKGYVLKIARRTNLMRPI